MARFLLDTHVLIWLDEGSTMLPIRYRHALEDPDNEIYLSAVNAWEIQTKKVKGTLVFEGSVAAHAERLGFLELPITIAHAEEAAALPPFHRDPFDRLLIAQARVEGLTMLSVDAAVRQYSVTCL
jgi:PIN domain nuclease of toxin-antitoxin system